MDQRVGFFLLLALGLLCLSLSPVTQANDLLDDGMDDDMDVEDELAGPEDEDLDGDLEDEAPSAPKPPPPPKVTYKAPEPVGEHFFAESFDRGTLDGWVLSNAKKDSADEEIAKYDGKWMVEEMKDSKLPGDKGLVLKSRAKHHAISAQLLRPFIFDTMPLIIQYEVNFQSGIDCGGAYIKLLTQTPDLDLDQFVDTTPYTIMFGPDKCGEDYKLHFIFRHKNPKTGEFEEKHAKKPDADLRSYYTDKKTHLYTLVVNPDNSFEVLIDNTVVNSGNLLTDMTPSVNPPAEIEDPNDHKPEDWDERAKIQDPDSVKPEDWDEEMDGEWEAPQIPNPACETAPGCGVWKRPMIDNPNYKGKWKPPMIDNPNYQGVWKPRKIANPAFFEDLHPFRMTPFNAVGLELWSMSSDIFFDNFFITNDRNTADRWANDGWGLKRAAESAAEPGLATQMLNAAEERPWLWVVYVLTVALPLILIIVFCCTGKQLSRSAQGHLSLDGLQEVFKETRSTNTSTGSKKSPATPAEYKKTDEPQPDVKEEEEQEEEEEKVEEAEKSGPEEKDDSEESPVKEEEEAEKDDEQEAVDEKSEDDILRRSPRNRKVRRD
uniref:Calnexin n=1 Tax=Cynoglossus semilaevis TaxID=244447 RepID=A0A3P8W570_CYNSE